MKRFLSLLLSLILIFSITSIIPLTADAASATISFSNSTLRPGTKFTITLNVTLSEANIIDGAFSYSSNITLNSVTSSLGNVDTNGDNIFVDFGGTTVSGIKAVATASFTVSNSAKAGEKVSISFSGEASNLNDDTKISGSSSRTLAAPLSTNCNLKSLKVGNATLSPAFSANKTAYSAGTVEYSVSKLNINAVAEDSKAKVTISGNSLAVGNNTVKILVKAESGATKTYTISVTRKQNPNYVPSSNASLSGIIVDGFLISPTFSRDVDHYVVWLPYETSSLTVKATPADAKAKVSITGTENLIAGSDNTITITCTAEDGTKKEYYLVARRASQDSEGEILPDEPDDKDTTVTPNQNEQQNGQQNEQQNEQQNDQQDSGGRLPIWVVVTLCVIGFLLGAFAMLLLTRFNVIRF